MRKSAMWHKGLTCRQFALDGITIIWNARMALKVQTISGVKMPKKNIALIKRVEKAVIAETVRPYQKNHPALSPF